MLANWNPILQKFLREEDYIGKAYFLKIKGALGFPLGSKGRSVFLYLDDIDGIIYFKSPTEIVQITTDSKTTYILSNSLLYEDYYTILRLIARIEEVGEEITDYAKYLTSNIEELRDLAKAKLFSQREDSYVSL